MPAEAYEDSLDLHIDLLEAVLPTLESPPEQLACYPFPYLRRIGDQETRRFRTLVLENDFLKITVVPALGGRILSIFDKRTQTEILSTRSALLTTPEPRRGVCLQDGIQYQYSVNPRLNSLGNTDSLVVQQLSDDSPAIIWIGETFSGGPVAFQYQIALAPNAAYFEVEYRAQNRTLSTVPYQGVVSASLPDSSLIHIDNGISISSENGGICFLFENGDFASVEGVSGLVNLSRNPESGTLGPRQTDVFRLTCVPFSNLFYPTAALEHGVGSLDQSTFKYQPTSPQLGHKLIVQNDAGETFETPLDAYPEHPVSLDLSSIPGSAAFAVVKSPDQTELLRLSSRSGEEKSRFAVEFAAPSDFDPSQSETQLRALTRTPQRFEALYSLATLKAKGSEFAEADALLEEALLFNGNDPVTWWAKAVFQRLGALSDESEERTELLNAHFLSPLEPALRAEAFLSQAQTHGKDSNPLVAVIEENPENFIEVACLLIELGLFAEATRWIDESLRHKDLAMLRYLQAHLYLTGSRMEVEAGEQVSLGHRAQVPPYPFRRVEIDALESLMARFRQDQKLDDLLKLAKLGIKARELGLQS